MTSKTPTDKEDAADVRLAELMRADAAAIIDDDLDEVASHRKTGAAGVRARSPSQVYSIRVPVERLEQVRSLASSRGLAPTAMMRQWVLARLDDELGEEPVGSSVRGTRHMAAAQATPRRPRRDAAADRLEAAVSVFAEAAAQLTTSVVTLAELFTSPSAGAARQPAIPPALSPYPPWPIAAAPRASQSVATFCALGNMPVALPSTGAAAPVYFYRGLAALQSTVQDAANWPAVSAYNLDNLYAAADEVLSGS